LALRTAENALRYMVRVIEEGEEVAVRWQLGCHRPPVSASLMIIVSRLQRSGFAADTALSDLSIALVGIRA
jgi:hypothetical protein